jgi:hypothetical protein
VAVIGYESLNEGFFPRKRVLNVTTRRLNGVIETYDQARIEARTRIIQIAIDARRQRFPQKRATSTGRSWVARTRTGGTWRLAPPC